jgi:hypothetical protein
MAAGSAAILASPADAATFEVTSNADDGSGGQTLREAIDLANADPDADTITFAASVTGEITLNGTELGITNPVSIEGPGADVLAVSGNDASRVFYIDGGSTPPPYMETSISDLRVTEGFSPTTAGGAMITLTTDLTLDRVTIDNSTIDESGPLVSRNAVGGGAAILGGETLIRDSTISGNEALDTNDISGWGGGVYALYGDVQIQRSTISGNTAGGEGGGGVFAYRPDSLEISDSTIAGNTAGIGEPSFGGGLIVLSDGAGATIDNSTIVDNEAAGWGGGVAMYSEYGSADVDLSSTIVDGNTAPTGSDLYDTPGYGGFDVEFSLLGTTAGTNEFTNAGDNLIGVDPELAPLADNGGPTQTMRPANSSPLIDAGTANGLATDQRGRPRTVDQTSITDADDGTDIGSVERTDFVPPVTSIDSGPADGATVDTADVSFEFSADEPATFECSFDGAPFSACTSPVDFTGLGNGTYTFRVRATDDDGNLGTTVEHTFTVDVQAPPPPPPITARCRGALATLVAEPGQKTIGTPGDDVIVGTPADDVIESLGGDDVVCAGGGDDQVSTGDGDDQVGGGGGNDSIDGGAGNDRLRGGAGDDAIGGAGGEDRLGAGPGDDALTGDAGDDVMRGFAGEDALRGGADDDDLRGGRDDDALEGGPGRDKLNGGQGSNTCAGGPGEDEEKNCG